MNILLVLTLLFEAVYLHVDLLGNFISNKRKITTTKRGKKERKKERKKGRKKGRNK